MGGPTERTPERQPERPPERQPEYFQPELDPGRGIGEGLAAAPPRINPYRPAMDPGEFRRTTMIEREPVTFGPDATNDSRNRFIDTVDAARNKLEEPPAAFLWRVTGEAAAAGYRDARAEAGAFSGALEDFVADSRARSRDGVSRMFAEGRAERDERAAALAAIDSRLAPSDGLVQLLREWTRAIDRSPLNWDELATLQERIQADLEQYQTKCMAEVKLTLGDDRLAVATMAHVQRLAGLGAEIARQGADLAKYKGVQKVWPSEAFAQRMLTDTGPNLLAKRLVTSGAALQAGWNTAIGVTARMVPSGSPAEKRWTPVKDAAATAIANTVSKIAGYRNSPASERDTRIAELTLHVTDLTTAFDNAAAELKTIESVPEDTRGDLRDASAMVADEIRARLTGLDALMDARQGKRVKQLIDVMATFRKNNPTTYETAAADLKPSALAGLWSQAKGALIKDVRNSGEPKAAERADKLDAAFNLDLRGTLDRYATEMARKPKYSQAALHDVLWELRGTLQTYRSGINAAFDTPKGTSNALEQRLYRALDVLQIAISNQVRQAASERKGSLF
jgi:hypothetical protein